MNTIKEKEMINTTAKEVDMEVTMIEEDTEILTIEEDVVITMTEAIVIKKLIFEIDIVKMTGGLEVVTCMIVMIGEETMTKCPLRPIVLRLLHLLPRITHDPPQPAKEVSTITPERIDRFRQARKAATGLLWMHLPQ